jgi:hypothetical protein
MEFLHPLYLWVRFFTDVFLLGFCQHLLLPGTVLLVVLLLSGRLGRGYGVYRLIRHEQLGKQFVVGLAFGFLLVKTVFVGYLLESKRVVNPRTLGRRHALPDLLQELAPDWLEDRIWVYLAGIAVSFGILLLGAGAVLAVLGLVVQRRSLRHTRGLSSPRTMAGPPPRAEDTVPVWPLALGLSTAAAGFVLLLLALEWVAPFAAALEGLGNLVFDGVQAAPLLANYVDPEPYRNAARSCAERPDLIALHGVALVSTVLSLAFYAVVVPLLRKRFSPAVPGCFLFDVLIAAFGWLAFFLPGAPPFLVILVLLLLALGGLSRYRVRFPHLDYRELQSLDNYPVPLPFAAVLRSEQLPLLSSDKIPWAVDGNKRPLAIVCASGGGIRAAAWTVAVLEQLERRFGERDVAFPYQVRLVTGASGGMVGAGYYVSTLERPKEGGVQRTAELTPERMLANVSQDSLSALVYRLVYGDLPKLLVPTPIVRDRGLVLEETWQANLDGALDQTFARLREGEKAGWRPSLIFPPMLVEDGRRLLISNLDLAAVTINEGNELKNTAAVYSREALEFFRLFPDAANTFRVSTATRMSASFPYFSPAGVLPTWPRRRVVDAGYFDNYGITVAAAWLFRYRDWVRDNASRVVLIQIRDSVSQAARTRPEVRDRSSILGRGLEWATSPPEGLLTAREWSMSFRNDELLRVLTDHFDRTVGELYFTTVAFEFGGDASLSWYLTQEEQASIRDQARTAGGSEEMDQLIDWWFHESAANQPS